MSPDFFSDNLAHDLSMPRICERMFDRRPSGSGIKTKPTAVANLLRIIPATLMLGNRHGFQTMSLRDLSRETGLSMGALYAHFESKEALLLMILEEVHFAVHHILVPAEFETNNPRQHLRWLLQRHVRMTTVMHAFFFFAFMEARNFHKPARVLAQEGELYTERLIADAIAALRPSDTEADHLFVASLIKPMLQDWYVKHWKYKRRGINAMQFTRLLTLWVEGMLASPAVGAAPTIS